MTSYTYVAKKKLACLKCGVLWETTASHRICPRCQQINKDVFVPKVANGLVSRKGGSLETK